MNQLISFFSTVLNTGKHGKPSLTTFKVLIKCCPVKKESLLTRLLSYCDPERNSSVNAFILDSVTEFVLSLGRFNGPLLNER